MAISPLQVQLLSGTFGKWITKGVPQPTFTNHSYQEIRATFYDESIFAMPHKSDPER